MARKGLISIILIIVATLTLAACGEEEQSLDPPEIAYGEDISEMGMFVTDPRYTVATLPEESDEWLLFDDIGELFKYRDAHPDAEFQVVWVNDYHSEEWLKAEDAFYVESTEINTPMGWGVAAFEDEADADAVATETSGQVMTWDEVEAREWTAPPAPDSHAGHGGTPGASPAATPATSATPAESSTPDHSGH